jgi:hypothetical protein
VEAVQPAGRHLGIGDDRHSRLQHLEQARLEHVLAQHHGLAAVAVDGVIDRLGPVRYRGDFQHRPGIGRGEIADEFSERSLHHGLVVLEHALEHDLTFGRHQQVLGDRLCHRQRPAAQAAGDRKLVGAFRHLRAHRGRGVMQRQIRADADHDRKVPAFALRPLEGEPQMPAEIELDSGAVAAGQHQPVVGGVVDAGVRIARDDDAGGNVAAGVGGGVVQRR